MRALPTGLDLEALRREFPTLAAGAYLLSHSLGPVPRSARESVLQYIRLWQGHAHVNAWEAGWMEISREVTGSFARIIGADDGAPATADCCVTVQPNATIAMAAIASCFDFSGPRRKVVMSALDFPTMGYLWDAHRRLGAEPYAVPSDEGVTVPMERLLEAIDPNTLLVAVSHVSYRSGQRLDVPAIVRRAREVGALVAVDVYQSAGVCEIDVASWGVDFLIGGTIKWLCGGPACAFLYVRPGLIAELRPRLTGWFGHARPFDYEHGPMEYAGSVQRFGTGTPDVPALYSCLPGLRMVEALGVPAIAAESRRRTQQIIEHGLARGWRFRCPLHPDRRGGTVMIDAADPGAAVAALAERRVFVDCRPGVGLRVSPHFFTSDDELEVALEAIGEVVR